MQRPALLVILVFCVVLGIAAPGQSEIVDRVAAVVNGEVITLSMVEDAMNAIWTDPERVPRSQRDALQKLIDHKLKLQEARRMGVIVSEESLSRELADTASRFDSPKELSEMLKQHDITQEDLEENLREQIMVREMVNRKFRLFAEVTEGEAAAFFEQHKEKFLMPEAAPSNRIFFRLTPKADEVAKSAVKKKAEAALKKLKNAADTYASKEGVVDYVLTETPIGYFIIKPSGQSQVRQAIFDEVKEEIKASLLQQKTDDELDIWLKRQRELADIRVKMEFKDQ